MARGADLPALAGKAGLGQPSLIIIGSVVTLRENLAWYVAGEQNSGGSRRS